MNHLSQRNQLEIRLKDYKYFVPFCSNDDLLKLLEEIKKIKSRIDTIRNMNINELTQPVIFQYQTRQSKCNQLNFNING